MKGCPGSELAERRRWIDEASFTRALNVCRLPPGPGAMQLAVLAGTTAAVPG